jgi:ribosome-associated toxin RatA of RatAB toxin-antitoxin module
MPDIKKRAIVPYTPAEMFNLVNAIEEYPQFVPWCKSTDILSRDADEVRATLNFARGALSKSFSTLNRLQHDKMIEIRLLEGPFKHLEGFWRFNPLPKNSCEILLDLEFEFSSRLMGFAFEPFFAQVANMLVDVFCKRAAEVYGNR